MAENLNSWGALVRGTGPAFMEFFSQNDMNAVNPWSPVITTKKGNDLVSNFSGKTGAGYLTRTADGSAVSSANRYKLYNTAITQEPYSSRLEITRQTLLYTDGGDLDASGDLIKSVKVTLVKAGAQIFNRAFTSGTGVTAGIRVTPYGDGVPLCSTVHPRADGGATQSNASSTGIPLTEANVETGRIALLNQLEDDGIAMVAPSKIFVVVGINNSKTAQIITKSDQRSATGNNDINIYGGGYMDVVESSYLDSGISASGVGSNTQWFLVAPDRSKLCIVISKGPDLEFNKDIDTKSGLFDVLIDLGVGFYSWHGVYGSQGANAAYSS
mgnify:CR=1 FL=1